MVCGLAKGTPRRVVKEQMIKLAQIEYTGGPATGKQTISQKPFPYGICADKFKQTQCPVRLLTVSSLVASELSSSSEKKEYAAPGREVCEMVFSGFDSLRSPMSSSSAAPLLQSTEYYGLNQTSL